MLEELKEEEIVNKVGGRFKLSTLIQKRLVQLNQGSRALVNVDTHDKMSIVLQEIMQDKITLDYAKGIAVIKLKGVELGVFEAGEVPVLLRITSDTIHFEDTPVLTSTGKSLKY